MMIINVEKNKYTYRELFQQLRANKQIFSHKPESYNNKKRHHTRRQWNISFIHSIDSAVCTLTCREREHMPQKKERIKFGNLILKK